MRIDRVVDLLDCHAQGSQPLGIKPNTDRIVTLTQVNNVANPLEPEQLVLHVNGRVIRHVDVVVAAVGGIEIDAQEDAWGLLLDGESLFLHGIGKLGNREVHPVLDGDQGLVEVGSDGESHDEVVGAGVVARRGHVQHVVNAVDLLLNRRRHRVSHDLGARSRIIDGHLHGWRNDVRILRNREIKD